MGSPFKKNTSVTRTTKANLFILMILLSVALAGYLVMSLEILAFRIIQARIDASIFSTGAVLGVVLAALTLGYWLGGNLSARFQPIKIQAVALIIAGLWIFTLAGIPNPVIEFFQFRETTTQENQPFLAQAWKTVPDWVIELPLGDSMDVRRRVDPLIASLILFAIPCFLLAMVGPCAIHALTTRAEDAGKKSGWVFALGSLGSIAGVLITSFFLVAWLGTSANLRIIGLVSILMGISLGLLKLPVISENTNLD